MEQTSATLRDPRTRAYYASRAGVLKAVGHATRLFLVDLLAAGPRCVCELTAQVGADTSTVSRHLAVLRQAGVVADERRGTQVFYRLATPCVLELLNCGGRVAREAVESRARALGPAGEQPAEGAA